MVGLSNGEKHFIRGGIEQDLRSDGRRRLHYRPISIETGVIPQANGSARVRIGSTDVIVIVKAALSNTGIPKVEVTYDASTDDQPEVDISDEDFSHLDTSGVPVIVTLTKIGRHYIVDATSEEEFQMSSAVSVSVNRHGQTCGFAKGVVLDWTRVLFLI